MKGEIRAGDGVGTTDALRRSPPISVAKLWMPSRWHYDNHCVCVD